MQKYSKIKRKLIRVTTSYRWKNFKQIRHASKVNFRCTFGVLSHHYQPEKLKSCSIKNYSTIS